MTREEALQAIKAKMDYYESDKRLRGALETLIPELAESEDEKIRKELVEKISNLACGCFISQEQKQNFLAYLEKQKELPTNEEMLRTLRAEYEKGVADTIAKYEQKEQKSLNISAASEWLRKHVSAYMNSEYNEFHKCVEYDGSIDKERLIKDFEESMKKEQIPYTDFVIKPHKGDDTNPYDMSASEAREYTIKRGFSIPLIDSEVYVDERHIIQTIGNILRWADEHPKEQKPIKLEVYEVGKGTTICGQDYKCKKDYKEGNCWYIKDVIYHCGRDGYLTDQNGVSWSCTPEWFKEYIYSNAEWAEKEKSEFVGGQFIQCNCTLDNGLKKGAHYWLEYVGDDTYVGRSDNILNQKFHITPRQLFTLFTQQLEENEKEQKPVPINPDDKQMLERIMVLVEFCNDKEIIWSWLCEKVKVAAQKPAWSEEDYGWLNEAIMMIQNKDGWIRSDDAPKGVVNWLKTLPERINLQPKQEWSEEDERRFISCMGRLQTADGAPTINSDWFEEHCYKHPSWKPSKEQMEALKECGECKRCIKELYEDLQKRYGTC